MNKLTYNNWMKYIHNELNPKPIKKIESTDTGYKLLF